MTINSKFDSGNIIVVDDSNPQNIQLEIRKDTNSDFMQWFHFNVADAKGKDLKLKIVNANEASYKKGFEDYNACASYDQKYWFRVPTTYNDGVLTIEHTPETESVSYAYFAPYSYEMHQNLISAARQAPNCRSEVIGQTVEGRNIDMLIAGKPGEDKKTIWVIARQHPGESMASWFMQGFILKLLDPFDPVGRKILENAVVYMVPHMNPDGAIAGNLRSNLAGANLNREWESPTLERSPEVYHVRNKMDETGIDLFLDIHGDEELPYNFVAGNEGNPNYSDRLRGLEDEFKKLWMAASPDFQDTHGYPKDEPKQGNMTVATNQVGHRFDCLAYTIEMPFKDNADMPDEEVGWSAERSEILGEGILLPVMQILDKVR
ncbi:M14 family metallopeptidase [Halocola ammonii]